MKPIIFNIVMLLMIVSGCTQTYPLDLGEGYSLAYDPSSYFEILDSQNTVILSSHIMAFGFDSIYIIAKQKPVEEILKWTHTISHITLKKSDELFKKSTLYYYWIIDKSNDSIYGPLTKESFLEKRKELNIPQNLVLHKIYNDMVDGR